MAAWSKLNARSRRTLVAFSCKLSLSTMASVALSVPAKRPLLAFASALELWLYACSVIAAFVAVIKRQRPVAGTMTQWDEALAFGALGFLVHIWLRAVG